MRKVLLILYYFMIKNLPSSYFPMGKFFNFLRIATLKGLIKIGKNNVIQTGFRFGMRDTLSIGDNCQINENVYIQSATLNGKPYNKTYITQDDIVQGGTLVFTMGATPNKQWGVAKESRPN